MSALQTLPVLFRVEPGVKGALGYPSDHVDVTAVFPTIPSTYDPTTFTVYAHVGQHSGGSRGWYHQTRKASPDQYADLLAELRGIYETGEDAVKLVITQRFTKFHDRERLAQLKRPG